MSLKDFMEKIDLADALAKAEGKELVQIGSTAKYVETLDAQTSAKTVSDEQYRIIKDKVAEFRKQIENGTFEPTRENLHTIVIWYRVSREEAFIAVKPKTVKEKVVKPKRETKKAKEARLLAEAQSKLELLGDFS